MWFDEVSPAATAAPPVRNWPDTQDPSTWNDAQRAAEAKRARRAARNLKGIR